MPDGRSEGPVALVDLDADGLAVRALGTLRAYRGNVTLRLVSMQGGTVLAAESEQCRSEAADGHDRSKCDRAIRVLPLVEGRFVDKPLADAAGRCLDSSFLPERKIGTAGDGTRYQLEATVAFAPDAITIREELALSGGPGRADPSFVTRVQAERKIALRNGRLFASERGLLARWLAREGALAFPPKAGGEAGRAVRPRRCTFIHEVCAEPRSAPVARRGRGRRWPSGCRSAPT